MIEARGTGTFEGLFSTSGWGLAQEKPADGDVREAQLVCHVKRHCWWFDFALLIALFSVFLLLQELR